MIDRNVPSPSNEPVFSYAPASQERQMLQQALDEMSKECPEIPCIIGGSRVTTGNLASVTSPHNHKHVIARYHQAAEGEVKQAIAAAQEARRTWGSMSRHARAAILLKAADLLAGPWRMRLNAATMLGQSKTCHQAEIDSACELIDFWRFNTHYADALHRQQPNSSAGVWNASELRPLDGFVLALTPFNFTAIAGNLPTAPALMGNTVLWKPSETQTLAAYHTYLLLEEAGLPPGVINFLPGDGATLSAAALADENFAGLHFTGSTQVFQSLWQQIGNKLSDYRSYPRIVGETGGKDFILAHPECDEAALTTALVRGAFEFQGQKCSAASRAYIPQSVWARIKDELLETTQSLTIGDVADFSNYLGALINQKAFERLAGAIKMARDDTHTSIAAGGECDDSKGWFVRPTIVVTEDPNHYLMKTELFGPLLTVYVYPDNTWNDVLELVDQTTPYALTGAVFARSRTVIQDATQALRFAAGNFYINDKPTGAVVGQQPFGGSRASGTNDKAGAPANLLRWCSPRTIKENLNPPTDYRYPFLG